jgi:hypothetical protein
VIDDMSKPLMNVMFPRDGVVGCEHATGAEHEEQDWADKFPERMQRVHEGLCPWCPRWLVNGVATTVRGLMEVGRCECCGFAFSVVRAGVPR